jgi:23S rRNA pseudouridine1911/1915/1917 synthase
MIRQCQIVVPPADAGKRLDRFLAERLPSTSRPLIARAIERGGIRLNGRPAVKGRRLAAGDRVLVLDLMEHADWKAAPNPDIPLSVIHADPAFLVLDKPAGLPVHPLEPGDTRTLVSALLAAHPELAGLGSDPLFPAIVHRLDADTSGVLLAARDEPAYRYFRRQFQTGAVEKRYIALVAGRVVSGGRLEQVLAHADGDTHRMVVVQGAGRGRHPLRAVTEYTPSRRLADFTLLDIRIHTGVTHQIRCQLASIGHPVACDRVYAGAAPAGYEGRLFLHAREIAFRHPRTGNPCRFISPLPEELKAALDQLDGVR